MLTVVGTLAWDTLARARSLARPEETAGVEAVTPDAFGGTAGNVAMAMARLGHPPRVLAAVGPDFARSAYETVLREARVDLSLLQRTDAPTSRAYVFFDAEGRQCTYFFAGASGRLRTMPLDGRVHLAAGEIARYPDLVAGAEFVSFDPGQELFHRDVADVVRVLPHVDVLFTNRHERAVLEKATDVARLFDGRLRALVETRGRDGTRLVTREGETVVPAVAAKAVDPTGAGDAHRAGFLVALERGADLETATRLGNVMGSFAVETVGPQASLPTMAQALARYGDAFGSSPW